jgi:Ca-activated chloride channel family protein
MRIWGAAPAVSIDPPRRFLKRILQSAAILALALAAARPSVRTQPSATIPKTGDIVFLLDVSRSMLADDVAPTRLARAKALIGEAARAAHGQRLALVAFAGGQSVECPLTVDHAFFLETLAAASRDSIPRGGSLLGDAIHFALEQVFDDVVRDRRTLVLLSDGGDPDPSAISAAGDAAFRDIRLVTIGIGSEDRGALVPQSATDPTPVIFQGQPVRTRLNAATLRGIAAAGPRGIYLPEMEAANLYQRHLAPAGARSALPGDEGSEWLVFIALSILLLAIEPYLADRKSQAATLVVMLTVLPTVMPAQTVAEWYAKGLDALKHGRAQEAMHYFGDSVLWAPDVPEIRFNLGKALYDYKAYWEASLSFEEAARRSHDLQFKANAKLGKGNALFRDSEHLPPIQSIQRLQQCLAAYREAQQLDPHVLHAAHNMEVAGRRLQAVSDRVFGKQPNPGTLGRPAGPTPQQVLDQTPRLRTSVARRLPAKGVERDW